MKKYKIYKEMVSSYKILDEFIKKRLLQIDKIYREVWGLRDNRYEIDCVWIDGNFIVFRDMSNNIFRFPIEYLDMDDNIIKQKEIRDREKEEKETKIEKIKDIEVLMEEYQEELVKLKGEIENGNK